MVHYETVLITIDAPGLAELILDVVVRHHGLPDSIVSDRGSVFTSKFWSSLCYFLDIKRRLFTAFQFRAFANFEQNDAVSIDYTLGGARVLATTVMS